MKLSTELNSYFLPNLSIYIFILKIAPGEEVCLFILYKKCIKSVNKLKSKLVKINNVQYGCFLIAHNYLTGNHIDKKILQ